MPFFFFNLIKNHVFIIIKIYNTVNNNYFSIIYSILNNFYLQNLQRNSRIFNYDENEGRFNHIEILRKLTFGNNNLKNLNK